MKLATQIFLGFLIAIFIDLLDSSVNYLLTLRVKSNSEFLGRSEAVIRRSADLNKGMLAMQGAFRGYLLTGDTGLLAPYDEGKKEVASSESQLRRLVGLQVQVSILDSIMLLYNRWQEYADGLIGARRRIGADIGAPEKLNRLLEARKKMGIGQEYNRRAVELFRSFDGIEYRQRNLRRKELEDSIDQTNRYSLVFSALLIVVGVAIALVLVRKISRRIGTLVQLAERISGGDFGKVVDDRKDELTSLSASLNTMSETLSRNIGELEKRNVELNQFAYVVSHDLKAPVRGISNVVRWIEEDHSEEIGPTVRKYLDFIPERIRRMEGLIDGLLEYARAGREGFGKQAVDVGELVGELVDLTVPDGYTVRLGHLPVIVTERLPLQQVLSNLIGNAVKYGPPGTTVVGVSGSDCGTHYEFTVEDNGPGIDPEFHEKIFGLFQTLRDKADKESTGIGLSIVRKIVEERGGKIRLVSSSGNGAKFIFTWPKTSV